MIKPEADVILRVEGLRKRFESQVVLDGVSLAVPRGSVVSVLGRSGAGKSVFLKCLAEVLQPDQGEVYFDGRSLYNDGPHARADFRKRCSFLFQGNALFDSLTALENVALPLEQTTGLPNKEIRRLSLEALEQLELGGHGDRYPGEMSGGMQKRLALARAIVTRPELVLFDEPTAGLDPLRRNAVFAMIARYQRQLRFTAVVVTHDVPEALAASDRVALLDNARMCFQGSPAEFRSSVDPVVREFRESTSALEESLAAIRRGEIIHAEDS